MIQCFAITLNTDNFETLTVDFFFNEVISCVLLSSFKSSCSFKNSLNSL